MHHVPPRPRVASRPLRAVLSRRGRFTLGALVLGVSTGAAQQAAGPTAKPLAFTGVTVVDVVDGRLLPKQTVIVTGNRVQAVGASDKVRVPAGAQVVDAQGKYLIPGLWDMHVHIQGNHQSFLTTLIAHGVTGVRQMSEFPGGLAKMSEWRKEIAAGTRIGPRIISTGPMLNRADMTVEYVRAAVDSLKAHGADFVKIAGNIDRLAPEVYQAIVGRAREIGIPLDGHLPNKLTEQDGSNSGQRTVEHFNEMHCWWPTDGTWPPSKFPAPDSIGLQRCVDAAQTFARNKTWLTPTLIISEMAPRLGGGFDPKFEYALQITGLFHRSGMPLLAGTDWDPNGALHLELGYFVDAGLSPIEALRTATLNPAKMLNATDSLGSIAPGKVADLVLLEADPLANIKNVEKIAAVVANGRYFDREALNGLATVKKWGAGTP